ncbi:MAG: hypothetical protein GY793_03770 [Proteobacteria bacterium]|nr:hypothetical protein [Pseudomonadota bacterium]
MKATNDKINRYFVRKLIEVLDGTDVDNICKANGENFNFDRCTSRLSPCKECPFYDIESLKTTLLALKTFIQ